ncbi:PKD domain-containing protein [Candidatus Bipolaricaulota sp. J31]
MRWKIGVGILALGTLILGGCRFLSEPPQALFSLKPKYGEAPLVVTCDGSLSFDEDGKIVEYIWDFGDGGKAFGPLVSHTYERPGTYTITLRVYDEDGLTDDRTLTVHVVPPPPTPDFIWGPLRPGTGELITFDASGSSSPNGEIVEYRWSFGDGKTATGKVVQYRYWYGGSYPVTLTVVDELGATATITKMVYVQGGPGCSG